MSRTTKFCNICEQRKNPPKCPGFLVGWEDSPITECPSCKNKNLITYNISDDDILIMGDISKDKLFFQSMIKLKEENPIEYASKMSQFRNQLEQQKIAAVQLENIIHCPYCKSTNTRKITTTAKAINTAVFGLLGTKRHKQWHCNNCNSDF